MRWIFCVLVVAGLSGCDQKGAPSESAARVQAASFSFDGADASDAAAINAHGERLSRILGCRGCHRDTLEGQWFNEDFPQVGKLYASNLTRTIPAMTDAQLEALLRTGKHPTRGDMWIMPSEVFQRLSDPDMKALIAHLRSVKPSGEPTPPPAFTDLGRKEVAEGKIKPTSSYMAEFRNVMPPAMGERYALGRYIAGATCAECHGADLKGVSDFEPSTPDLDIVGTYSDSQLVELLTTGKGKSRADLGLMTLVGKGHFSYLTPHERTELIAYLKARAARPH